MCYNCGCGLPDDDMGVGDALSDPNGQSITNITFAKCAEKWNLTEGEAKELTYQLLVGEKKDAEKEAFLEGLYDEAAKSQGMTIEEAKEETQRLLHEVLQKN